MSRELNDIPLPQRDADNTAKIIVETRNGPHFAWLQLFLPKHEDDTPFFRIVSDSYQLRLADSHLWTTFEGTAPLSRSGPAKLNRGISGNSGHHAGLKAVWQAGVTDEIS